MTPGTIQSVEFSRPQYWSGQPFPSPGDLPNPGIEPRSPALQADSLPFEPTGKPKNTGVGSLFLLQENFPTQELKWAPAMQADSLPAQLPGKPSVSYAAAAAAKSLQSCATLCDPRDGSPPGSPVPGIFQARTLEWVAISFSNA